ncbi:integrase/recombinase XerC [Cnuella takakiae]|uniref:Tyrosine recombinase XerC n=1 Tax=Cnuella takakiae TaxID=1302690 RepID=A0A1M4ZXY8_9BACT|nr:tyrosine-type recombinase/integrase [Cnuella takakiae]OLY92164.1 hypothetical protein BUE76_09845 [Cnuella takakiae]SHF22943.1 integrase/recombinase XerC [Cnuella takakiae]
MAHPHPVIEPFLHYLQYEKRYSAHTVLAYQTDLIQFFDFVQTDFGGMELPAIGHTHIRSWLAALKGAEQTARTLNRKISSLRAFFKYLVKTGKLEKSPMGKVVAPKAEKRLPSFLSEQDVRKLFEAQPDPSVPERFPEHDYDLQTDKMLLLLFYHTGMRLSEALGLQEQNIHLGAGNLKVLGKGNKERIIPITHTLADAIRKYAAHKRHHLEQPHHESGCLLLNKKGQPLQPRAAYERVKHHLDEVTTISKRSPHVLRHTFATHLTNKGADLNAVKELLGHSSLAATQVYTHNTIEQLKDIYRKAHPKA